MDKYTVQVPPAIFDQISSIKRYIEEILQSPLAAEKKVRSILKGIKSLESFPERGFDADAKVGRKISKTVSTKGILINNRKFLLFYTINEKEKVVHITHLLSSQTDYAKLFL